jgi:hypothetical protein
MEKLIEKLTNGWAIDCREVREFIFDIGTYREYDGSGNWLAEE